MKIVLNVEGMSCAHCVRAVNEALAALDGVDGVQVDLEGKTATVEYQEGKVSVDNMKEAIEEEGYEVV